MRKLTRQEILALQPTTQLFHVKLWRLWQPAPHLIWEGDTQLHIQRTVPSRRYPEQLALVTAKGHGWAEGSAGDVTDQGDVVVEDYWMEIFHIE